jgi:ABC-type amino acid transport substrate-binding protein
MALPTRSLPMIAAFACALLICARMCQAQAQDLQKTETPAQPELLIGTKEAPPFAMKAADGTWQGISIDLWRRIADELHLRYRFDEEASVPDLIAGVATGKFDIVAAAMTVTAERARILDFTQPFYATGLGIAILLAGSQAGSRSSARSRRLVLPRRSRPWWAWRWPWDFWSGSLSGVTMKTSAAASSKG